MSAPLPMLGKLFCLMVATTALQAGRPAILVNATASSWLLLLTGEKPKQGRVVFARVDPATGAVRDSAGLDLDDWFSAGIPLAPGASLHITSADTKVVNLAVPMALVGQGGRSLEKYPFLYQENSARGDALLVPGGEPQTRQGSARWREVERGTLQLETLAAEAEGGAAEAGETRVEPEAKAGRSGVCAIL